MTGEMKSNFTQKKTEFKLDKVELTRKCCFPEGVFQLWGRLTQLRVVKKKKKTQINKTNKQKKNPLLIE